MNARTWRTIVRMSFVAAGLALSMVALPDAVEAQRRGVQQRNTPLRGNATDAAPQRQGQLLLDRFSRRVGEALNLGEAATERLLRELQESRAQRGRLQAQVQASRRELAQLIQEEPADEERIANLIDELMALDIQRAEIAQDEQRRLSAFMTPLQRARLVWFQQQAARQALQRRDGPMDEPGGSP